MKTDNLPGLYIHIPFCERKCRYCDFFSVPPSGRIGPWMEALFREAEERAGFAPEFGSLYLGGGTPSLLAPDQLGEIISRLKQSFSFSGSCEVTMEVNPEHAAFGYLNELAGAGINRISLGVQSFRDNELELIGRRHRAEDSERALELALLSGIENVSIDLIFALPFQNPDQWRYNLRRAASFRPQHVSCYQLTVKSGTEMDRLARDGQLLIPGEDRQREMFTEASGILSDNGYFHYEVSNFSLGKKKMSRHNLVYWRHLPYLGLGPSAHSFDGRNRWWNSCSLEDYINKEAGESAGLETLSGRELDLEKIFLGMRTFEGVDIELAKKCQSDEGVIDMLTGEGLARVNDGRLIPTVEGYLLADRIPLYFT
jgi:oxygen-independent coproporphyrinogen-3 oxidase